MSNCNVVSATIIAVAIWGASFSPEIARLGSQVGVKADACRLDKQGTFGDNFRLKPTNRPAPMLSDLPRLPRESRVFIEVRIETNGRVSGGCIIRGVRPDVDARVLTAVRRWRFAPPRLSTPAIRENGRILPAGTPVPVVATLSVDVGSPQWRDRYLQWMD